MLVGRERECANIDRLLELARGGDSGGLVLRGEPGVGKSALLDYAAERAEGMSVTRTAGVESEAELQFAGLLDVCRPLLGKLDALPGPQAAAVRGALGIGPAEPAERFAVGAATFALLAAAAEEAPLLVLVDDAHWVDRSTIEALAFAIRRLRADRVAVLFAVREDEAFELDVQAIQLGGLDREAATSLLAGAASIRPTSEVVDRLHEATNGNPLALLELPSLLTPEQLSGATAIAEPLPMVPALEREYLKRTEGFPDETRRALLVASVSASEEADPIVSALGLMGLDASALEPAEDAGLLRIESGRAVFRHPLARSAIVHAARPADRRAAHRALADALANRGREDERAWHLAAAALGPDEEAAAALAAAATRAAGRGAEAAAAFEQAARLTSDDRARAQWLADAAVAAGESSLHHRSAALAEAAISASDDPALRARCLHVRARAEFATGSPGAGRDLLEEAAELAEGVDLDLAVDSLGRAVPYAIHAGEGASAVRVARRCRELAPTDGSPADCRAELELGQALAFAGLAEGRSHLERAVECYAAAENYRDRNVAAIALVLLDRVAEAYEVAKGVARAARETGPGAVAFALEPAAWSDLRAGRWQRARLAASEGLALGRDLKISTLIATFAALHAQIDAGRGDEESARAHASEALALAEVQGLALVEQWARCALGLLELGLGRFDAAHELLTAVARRMAEMELFYRDVAPEPDLVELHARRGELTEARAWLETWTARGGRSSSAWFAAVEARCNGIVAEDGRFETHFEQALAAHASAPDRFAEARTRLTFGERLRRAARRVDAREHLRSAVTLFDEVGAAPWAERARAELRATGETLRRREEHEEEELTPQELQIALQVAEGKTNKEVGAALFLSPKTIEFHLKRVFRKLGLRSRGELIRRFATSPP